MTEWQLLYLVLLTGATLTGKPPIALVAVMWLNFCATVMFNGNFYSVAVADIACGSVLAMRGRREWIVSTIFLSMVPIYLAATHFGLSHNTTYAVIDGLAYVQLFVMGKWDGGMVRFYRHMRGRRAVGSIAVAAAHNNQANSRFHQKAGQ